MPNSDLWYTSALDAARATSISADALYKRLHKGEIPGAYLDEESGQWRIPLQSLLDLGYKATGEGAHRIAPISDDPRSFNSALQLEILRLREERDSLARERDQLQARLDSRLLDEEDDL